MREARPEVHFLAGQRFECTSCGKCCAGAWNVPVNSKAREVIEESQVYASGTKDGYIPLIVADDGKVSLGRQSNGHCVFLAEDNLCNLHREVGAKDKPVVCRTYPQLVTNTPDGYFVSLSFACPAVLDNQGDLLTAGKGELQELLHEFAPEVPQNTPVAAIVNLTEAQTVTWGEYKTLEGRLLQAFNPMQPALSALVMAEQLLDACASGNQALLLDQGFDTNLQPGPLGNQLLDLFTLHSLAILELETQPEERVRLMERLAGGEAVVSTRHGFSLHLDDAVTQAREEDAELIRFYFQNIVFGKRLTTSTVTDGLLTVAVGLSLLLFYLEVFRPGVDLQEARERAFEIVEADVVTHSHGLDVLLNEFGKALSQQSP